MSDIDVLRARFVESGRACRQFTDAELYDAGHLATALREHLKSEALELVAQSGAQPILYAYQNDGTSYLCSAKTSLRAFGRCIRRGGKVLSEYLDGIRIPENGHL